MTHLDEKTTVPEDRGEIVHVDRSGPVIEIVKQPVKINIGVSLPADEDWFWVEFDCWGQGCGTIFLSVPDALEWCLVCYSRNLNSPIRIKDKHGNNVYEEDALRDYFRDKL